MLRGICQPPSTVNRLLLLLAVAILLPRPIVGADDVDKVADRAQPIVRSLIELYASDQKSLRRSYATAMSPLRDRLFRQLYKSWTHRVAAVDFEKLNQDGKVDYLLLKNQLEHDIKQLEYENRRDAAIKPMLPFWRGIVELEDRRRQMRGINAEKSAAQLEQLRHQVIESRRAAAEAIQKDQKLTPSVVHRAANRVRGLKSALRSWNRFYSGYDPTFSWWVKKPYESLTAELERFESFLRDRGVYARVGPERLVGEPIGRQALLDELRYEWISYTPEELVEIANKEFAWCDRQMAKASRELGFGDDWRKAMEHVKNKHVGPGKQPELIRKLAHEAIEFLDQRKLVSIPKLCRESWRMEMMTPARQRVNPYFTGGEVISVSYPTDTMTHAEKMMTMRGNNIHFSRAVVHHELIPGHHLQLYMADRYQTHRQLFRTPFLVEGWALYWEMLLWDMNFQQSAEDRVGMLFWRKHRCARIIFSLSYHLNKMTADECVEFLIQRVGHERKNAAAEVRRSIEGAYGPLYQAAYMLGGLQIRDLRRELVDTKKMSDRQFHDAILRENSIPIEMIRAKLTSRPLTRRQRSSWQFYPQVKASNRAGSAIGKSTKSLAAGKTRPTTKLVGSPQTTPAELKASYTRAEALRGSTQGKTFKRSIRPNWIPNQPFFWYRNALRGGKREFILVDAKKGKRALAFDHQKLAAALTKAGGSEIDPEKLPFDSLRWSKDRGTVFFAVGRKKWACDLKTYQCRMADPPAKPEPSNKSGGRRRRRRSRDRSPDGKWTVLVRDHNLVLRSVPEGKEFPLTKDGNENKYYGSYRWTPDSKAVIACRITPGQLSEVHLLEASPRDGIKARLHSRTYAQPGDKFTEYEMLVFDVQSKATKKVQTEPVDFRGPPRLRWIRGGTHFTFQRTDRGHQRLRVVEVEVATGKTRNIIDERAKTFIDGTRVFAHYIDASNEIIWASERDGWRHLYLFDGDAGKIKKQITKGRWVVRRIDRVDDEKRQIWFRASGKNEGQDPYLVHYYRVNFDGSNLVQLTAGDGHHSVQYSPDGKYLIDTFSRVDLAPVSQLRRVVDGSLVCDLEKADITALVETGWRPPEVFVAKGRDGKTDIWGIVCRPRGFDVAKRYPVIEYIYAGPHDSHVPKSFRSFYRMQALAELGFVVVQMDGMGTANRGKAFHDVCWKNLADAGFPDRIKWLQALARRYTNLDLTRVGIFGTSAGGQSSTGALLFHPEFYKVAVSACGCHDNRVDKAWWNEQWMGYPIGEHYGKQSNVTNAHRLQGKLLLIVGDMDTNVPPESTYQVVGSLIDSKKDFDLLVIPGMGHSDGGSYGRRRRWDYFVRHLHQVEPPNRNGKSAETE